jgi:endonuclease/exonuclease/phosphatase family metal-dependent hydrolase
MELKVATYNVHRCIGNDRRHMPERTGDVIAELDADVIALQEVESPLDGSPYALFEIAERAGYRVIEGVTLHKPEAHYGNAVLTRLPVARIDRVNLSYGRREPRGALNLHLSKDGHDFQLVATHLGLGPSERRYQTQKLISLIHPDQSRIAILMGDLNEWFLWGRPLRWLHRLFSESPAPHSFPAGWPLFALDRIWINPRHALQSIHAHRSALARRASDHLPVCAVLRFTG